MQKYFWTLQTLELILSVMVLVVLDEVVDVGKRLAATLAHRN